MPERSVTRDQPDSVSAPDGPGSIGRAGAHGGKKGRLIAQSARKHGRFDVIAGDGRPARLTADQVIGEEIRAFSARLRLRAAALHPEDAEIVSSLADQLAERAASWPRL